MNKPYFLPILLSVTLVIGLFTGNLLTSKLGSNGNAQEVTDYTKLKDIIEILDQKYVDTINGNKLFEETISDMLHKLDPHSNYIPASELALLNESIEGQFGGVGVRFFIIRDTICVTNVVRFSPSSKAGLLSGDKIISVNGKNVTGKEISNEKVMKLLKGKPGTDVQLKIWRDGKILAKKVTRDLIPIHSVSSFYMIDHNTGYVHIDEFSMTTADEFRVATASLKAKGMTKLVLDLRNNGGGLLRAAIEIADEFLKNNVEIVSTKGQHAPEQKYYATSRGSLEDTKLVIMINSSSASASEILAGAIQDNDRGYIVGRRSFGKGLVQEDVNLRDGSNLRLTIARYYTPSGRCIQKSYKKGYEDYYKDFMNRYDSGEMYHEDTTLMVDSLKYKTKKGRIVYGGGGIMPDVFVPFDSTGNSWYFTDLRMTQAFNVFAFDYLQGKRNQFTSMTQFKNQFVVTKVLLDQFVNFAEKELKVKKQAKDFITSKTLIEKSLKAEIARQIWLEDGYYFISNASDNEFQAALKKLK